MKITPLLLLIMLLISSGVYAQNGLVSTESTQIDDVQQPTYVATDRYQLYSDYSNTETLLLALNLERLFSFYNRYFNFNPDLLPAKLKVRYFSSKSRFDNYMRRVADRTYDHFVYIDYNDSAYNELVLYPIDNADNFNSLLAHFSFVQFIEGFITNPPAWLREGFAIYFKSSRYDSADDVVRFQENNHWLELLKKAIAQKELEWNNLLLAGISEISSTNHTFYAHAWGLVSFLVDNRDRSNEKLFQNIIASLDSGASEEQNLTAAQEVLAAAFSLGDLEGDLESESESESESELEKRFVHYIESRPSFREIVQQGIEAYNTQRLEDASGHFYMAILLDSTNHTPYYYLGLVNYERGQHESAEYFYIEALRHTKSHQGIIYYALGLNALLKGYVQEAQEYLDIAKDHAPELTELIDQSLNDI